MIKLIAALLMVIDHAGYIFFPHMIGFRLMGRLSMPLFAYSIARGYAHSWENKTLTRYLRNLAIFTVIAQLPYSMMMGLKLNIGATWVLSLLLLMILGGDKKLSSRDFLACLMVGAAAFFLKVDYGLYGVITPTIMYFFLIKNYDSFKTLNGMVISWAFYVMIQRGSLIQIAACAAIPILAVVIPVDNRIRLPKWFFYAFYPTHILVLLAIHAII